MKTKKHSLLTRPITIIVLIVFISLTIWWISLSPFNPTAESEGARNIWGGVYQVLAYLGGIVGLVMSKKWGGRKSLLGKSILAFSASLTLDSSSLFTDSCVRSAVTGISTPSMLTVGWIP